MKLLESDIQRTILDWLCLHRIFHWRNNVGAFKGEYGGKNRFIRFGWPGSPDIFVINRGRILGIEVKGPRGKQSPQQKEFANGFAHAGGIYILARSLEDVTKELEVTS